MKLYNLLFIIIYSLLTTNIATAESISLEIPPASLSQWYKPDNKRQVWLHTMFKLRREMQAMRTYAEQEDANGMQKWMASFNEHYKKIPEMVPEWKDKIKPQLLIELNEHTKNKDFFHVALTLNKIDDTCDSCHKDYQPQVTAIYRSPDYDKLRIQDIHGSPQNIENNMQELSIFVNQILISLADKNNKAALVASENLDLQLDKLGAICSDCHKNDKYPRERILGKITKDNISKLQNYIREDKIKDSQQIMGTIAVTVCARCHNTHKIISDLREQIQPEKIH